MVARFRKNQTTHHIEPLARNLMVVVPPVDAPRSGAQHEVDRKSSRLRNRIILANAAIWIAVFVAIRLIFF
jgi:hypothetical protein